MSVAMVLAIVALTLSMAQFFFGILGLMAFLITTLNFCLVYKTRRIGMLAAAVFECCISGIFLVHAFGIDSTCDPTSFRYLPCETWPLYTAAALWLISGTIIFYFVFSGRLEHYQKPEAPPMPEAYAQQIIMPESSDEEDSSLGSDESSNEESEEEPAPMTPATPVDNVEEGTIAYLPNGREDHFDR